MRPFGLLLHSYKLIKRERKMINTPNKTRFFFILVIYFILTIFDAWLLFKGLYNVRLITKLTSIPILGVWFYANTSSKLLVAPNTYHVRFLVYVALVFSYISDILNLFYENLICFEACLILFTFIYILYIFIVIDVQKSVAANEKYFLHLRYLLPAFVGITIMGIIFLYKVMDDWWLFYNVMVILHVFVIILFVSLSFNSIGEPGMKKLWIYLVAAVLCMIVANLGFGISDLVYHRRHRILDVPVAIGNGLSQALMILTTIKFVQRQWGINEIEMN